MLSGVYCAPEKTTHAQKLFQSFDETQREKLRELRSREYNSQEELSKSLASTNVLHYFFAFADPSRCSALGHSKKRRNSSRDALPQKRRKGEPRLSDGGARRKHGKTGTDSDRGEEDMDLDELEKDDREYDDKRRGREHWLHQGPESYSG